MKKNNISKANRITESVDFPQNILIDNCNACNLQCSMCDHVNIKNYRKIQLMDINLYKKIINEIAIINPSSRVWEIFFGDPFLCHDMAKRIQYAKDKGLLDVVLNSNGVMMSEKKSRKLIEAGLDALYIGIDASQEDTYNKIRKGGDFSKVIKNVLTYRDILASVNNQQQKLYVQFVISEHNEDEVNEFKEFWLRQGINVKIRPKISWAGLIQAENLFNNTEVQRKPCYWLMQTINICADGRVAFCSVDIHCRVECGDVNRASITEIWSNQLKQYRKMHLDGKYNDLPKMCQQCSDWQSAYAVFPLLD